MSTRRSLLAAMGGLVSACLVLPKSLSAFAGASSVSGARTDAHWRAVLSPEVYDVMRNKGVELPGSSPLLSEHRKGVFSCAACQSPLFSSESRLSSAVGWPCFSTSLEHATSSTPVVHFGAQRLEVSCGDCGGHLGLALEDGSAGADVRFCINGIALKFTPIA